MILSTLYGPSRLNIIWLKGFLGVIRLSVLTRSV